MNLKNNYLLKKLLKWANKKCKNFNITKIKKNIKKIKKNTQRYDYFIPVYQQSSWYDLKFLRYRVLDRLELVIMVHFLPFYPPPLKTQKIRILKEWKKLLEKSSFYTSVPKTRIIWGTVPEIRSETDKIFIILGHFLPFYPPNYRENQNLKNMKKSSWDLII